MRRYFVLGIRLLVLAALLLGPRAPFARSYCFVPVYRDQEQSYWCWAGAAQILRASYGRWRNQCADANYARVQQICGMPAGQDCCVNPASCNRACWPQILSTNIVSIRDGALSWNEVKGYLPGGSGCKPFIFAYQSGGPTHYRVASGYEESYSGSGYIYFQDPNPLYRNETYVLYNDYSVKSAAVWYNFQP